MAAVRPASPAAAALPSIEQQASTGIEEPPSSPAPASSSSAFDAYKSIFREFGIPLLLPGLLFNVSQGMIALCVPIACRLLLPSSSSSSSASTAATLAPSPSSCSASASPATTSSSSSSFFDSIPIISGLLSMLSSADPAAGVILGGFALGRVLFNIPAALACQSYRSRRIVITALLTMAAIGALMAFWLTIPGMLILCFLNSVATSYFFTGRLRLIGKAKPASDRGKFISMSGSSRRLGLLLGPFIGGAVISCFGVRIALLLQLPALLVASYCFGTSMLLKDVDQKLHEEQQEATVVMASSLSEILAVFVKYRFTLTRVGFFTCSIWVFRAARALVLPLLCLNVGFDPSVIGLIVASSFVVDASFCWFGGYLMDTYGRKYSAGPASFAYGLTFIVCIFATTPLRVFLCAICFGLGDSVGSGIADTLMVDHTPKEGGPMLMGWHRVVSDAGAIIGPVLVAALIHWSTFDASLVLLSIWGFVAAVYAFTLLPEIPLAAVSSSSATGNTTTSTTTGPKGDASSHVVVVMMIEEEPRHAEVEQDLNTCGCNEVAVERPH